ncbi:MAG: antitoxin [Idiomarina sp.]|uniref:type II RES/Xre toxin-antitoxin system antitoxin n=1 Tax=Idiomarina sp. TaxID=1874361 RepID=UPI000C57757F|nr:antitoxin Xre/MbcA/ParS toxin-binding domain-containing protein [Idiomarina sp.]MBT41084.1 antitoxin [Idiomarina sp.]
MELREYTPVSGPQDIWSELGLPNEDAKLREQVSNGFSIKLFNSLLSIVGMQQKTMQDVLRIPATTFSRRKDKGRFTMEESDRLYSLIEVFSRATDLFEGDRRAAAEWMNKKVPGLGDKRPIEMIDSHANTQAVLDLITRLEYGVYS